MPYLRVNSHLRFRLGDVRQMRDAQTVRNVRALEDQHAETADLGGDASITDEELDIFAASHPGILPWNR